MIFGISMLKLGGNIIGFYYPPLQYKIYETRDALVSISNALNLRSHSWDMYSPDPPIQYGIPKLYIEHFCVDNRLVNNKNNIVQLDVLSNDRFLLMVSNHLNDVFIFDNFQDTASQNAIKKQYKDIVLNGLGSYVCNNHASLLKKECIEDVKYQHIFHYAVDVYNGSNFHYKIKLFEMVCLQLLPSI